MAPNDHQNGLKVEMYKIANRLKERMGIRFKGVEQGFLDPETIAEADKLIATLCETCPQANTEHLQTLGELWDKMRDMPQSEERTELAQKIFTTAHEIKDLASMCGYELTAYFAESLRDYIARTDLNLKAQVVIIQAHLDALNVVNRQGVKNNAGPEAEQLKKMVKMAIEKYQ